MSKNWSFIVVSILYVLAAYQTKAQDIGSCILTEDISPEDDFPEQILLSYGETRIFNLDDYWGGVNLTFSIQPIPNVTLPSKLNFTNAYFY